MEVDTGPKLNMHRESSSLVYKQPFSIGFFSISIPRHKNRLMVHMSISTMCIIPNGENHLRIFGGCASIPCIIIDKRETFVRDNDDKPDLYANTGLKIR